MPKQHVTWLSSASPFWAVWRKARPQRDVNLVVNSCTLHGTLSVSLSLSLLGEESLVFYVYLSSEGVVKAVGETKKYQSSNLVSNNQFAPPSLVVYDNYPLYSHFYLKGAVHVIFRNITIISSRNMTSVTVQP